MDERGLVWRSSSNVGGVTAVERPRASTPNCPRCGSSNTKFCYYNNYSLSQPRFFCKSCRRYWTKGGSLRNVPVGGASRKSRNHRTIRSSSLPPPPPSYHHHLHNNNNIINTTKPSLSHGSGSHIDLAVVYANFLNTTSSSNPQLHHQLPPPPALVHGNVDPAGEDQDPMMMMQYYCQPEGCGGLDDAWTASNDHEGRLPLLPPAGDQGISLFHVSSSSNPHHQEKQLPPPDHGYSDLMMMFGNSAWSSFEISAAADLNLR
ncbi:unnamed protein product [Linum trigynum]|uniref:Dof zinc finger protein n=1 Tax=Linum trigynum TaxID=586398 RepID=A0AAV2CVL6_9ROSI